MAALPGGGGGGPEASATYDVIKDIPEDVAMAREYSLLGAYDVALAYYDRAVSAVARYMRLLVDTGDRNKWAKVGAPPRADGW
jgi:hypothetical protein